LPYFQLSIEEKLSFAYLVAPGSLYINEELTYGWFEASDHVEDKSVPYEPHQKQYRQYHCDQMTLSGSQIEEMQLSISSRGIVIAG
jgi:hypothetical protein